MIEVKSLCKHYGRHVAVDGISFRAEAGQVLGFLGPNGAGKSTTMKVITGFLLPTAGSVKVGGFDVVEESLKVQRLIGYLPESASSYGEMTVGEFLSFVGELHGLKGEVLSNRTAEVMKLIGLKGTRDRIIDTLSKGYRQRVCFAQAVIHDPAVLILDEPTDGLDPNQKHHVRALIRQMGRRKTIILSTHILEEMEAVCDRAVVINEGKIAFNGTPKEMAALSVFHQALAVVTDTGDEKTLKILTSAPRVKEVRSENIDDGWRHYLLPEQPAQADYAVKVEAYLRNKKLNILEIYTERGRVDEVFRTLTKDSGAISRKITGRVAFGSESVSNKKVASSKAVGSKSASGKVVGSKAVGSKSASGKVVGSKAVGSKSASSKSVGSKAVGSKSASSKSVGSKAVGSKSASSKAVGSKAVGSKSASGKVVGSKAVGSKSASSRYTKSKAKGI